MPARGEPAELALFLDVKRAEPRGLKLVSTLPFGRSAVWREHVETIATRDGRSGFLGRRLGIEDPGLIPRLLRAARVVQRSRAVQARAALLAQAQLTVDL